MPYIRETILTTVDGQGRVHIAPLGIIADGARPEPSSSMRTMK